MIIEAAQKGGNQMVIVNAANEAVVQLFLSSKIAFLQIETIIKECLNTFPYKEIMSIEEMVQLVNFLLMELAKELMELALVLAQHKLFILGMHMFREDLEKGMLTTFELQRLFLVKI